MDPGGNPYDAARAPHTSPPLSQHPSGSTTDGYSRGTSNRSPGSHLSSASSLARSSEGGGLYSPVMSESGRSFPPRSEDALLEHYNILRRYLGASLAQDAAGKSSRARDKLLRLSPTQFHELSTDVYDELLRREDERQRRVPNVPPHLLPTKSFHPKRNQARQKLSTLPPERFKQLATDVYFELERRVPRLGAGSIERSASPAMSVASSHRSNGPRGPPPGMRGPPGYPQGGMPPHGRGPPPDRAQFPSRSSSHDYGRPIPKTFQTNTLVPNKATMVEGDESEDETPVSAEQARRDADDGGLSKEQVQALETQIADLQNNMSRLETKLQEKDQIIQTLQSSKQQHEETLAKEQDGWERTRSELHQQLTQLQQSAETHHAELERTNETHAKREASWRDELEQNVTELQAQIDGLTEENNTLRKHAGSGGAGEADQWREQAEILEQELVNQRQVTEDVREKAAHFLEEMRELSQRSGVALEREEQLQGQIKSLSAEVEEWKSRYAKTKTELRTLKASSIGLPLQNMLGDALSARQHHLSNDGLVNDVEVTGYQMSIDDLLSAARQGSSDATLDKMKVVIGHVQQITASTQDDYTGLPSPAESPNPMAPPPPSGTPPSSATLKARVSRNATGLITATRNYVASDGLSPVSLVDAAAANLTAAVVDYVKTVGIKASTSKDLGHDVDLDEGFELLPSTTHVPQLSTNGQRGGAPHEPMAGNGWFSRLKGSFDSSYSNDLVSPSSLRDSESEYNSYR